MEIFFVMVFPFESVWDIVANFSHWLAYLVPEILFQNFYRSMCKGLVVFVGGVFFVRAVSDEWDSL